MTSINSNKHRHLTLNERIEIQDCLNHGMTFKAIAMRIGKDQSTVRVQSLREKARPV